MPWRRDQTGASATALADALVFASSASNLTGELKGAGHRSKSGVPLGRHRHRALWPFHLDQSKFPIWTWWAGQPPVTLGRMSGATHAPIRNHLEQPIGAPVEDWRPRPRPPHVSMEGRLCRLEPLRAERHAEALFARYADAADARDWTYLPYGPFDSAQAYTALVESVQHGTDKLFYAIDAGAGPVGVAAYMRIDPDNGSMEVGHVNYTPALQRHPAATEAMYLMMRRAFDELGYRRYEWKCHALNARSRAAAERLGFTYEGTHRQVLVAKGHNRDTAWFSILDCEWPEVRARLETWLSPDNFHADGTQRRPLREC